jgi:hypothetical protein
MRSVHLVKPLNLSILSTSPYLLPQDSFSLRIPLLKEEGKFAYQTPVLSFNLPDTFTTCRKLQTKPLKPFKPFKPLSRPLRRACPEVRAGLSVGEERRIPLTQGSRHCTKASAATSHKHGLNRGLNGLKDFADFKPFKPLNPTPLQPHLPPRASSGKAFQTFQPFRPFKPHPTFSRRTHSLSASLS